MQVDGGRAAGVRLTYQALDGRRPRVGEAAVDDGEQVDVAAAGPESAGAATRRPDPKGQAVLAYALLGALAVVVVGSMAGEA
ncbi:hypothetical protein, partial [Actinoplanes sp. NPDC005259]|uniref:hypothetical protein n=1 Tax=Actinoplanes sp. NPDC005259 TaxID=3154674 RepID=UPI0033B48006